MNFGGGGGMPPFGNGMPPYGSGMPPFVTGMPQYPPGAQMGIPVQQGFIPQQVAPAQPTGLGPLGDRVAQVGANGLYQAPEEEGPEEHEASEYLKLSPGEAVKYDEYWAEASAGEERVGGREAREVLGRAARVSKTQLRLIWGIADHRKEGELDRSQFHIALRLIALAQRGAEISVKGLRNFVGIQLIPDIAPAPQPAATQPSAQIDANLAVPTGSSSSSAPAPGFSWTVASDVATRYDNFFTSIDPTSSGFVDGRAGVAFFGKSGLPRPVLRKVWQLADVTRDGKLDRDEFRSAMHMVANLRTGKLKESELPSELDPAGPNWFRLEEDVRQGMQQMQEQPQVLPVAEQIIGQNQPPQHTPPAPNVMDDDALLFAVPPPGAPVPGHLPPGVTVATPPSTNAGNLLGGTISPRRAPKASSSSSLGEASPRATARGDDTIALREKLRVEQQEAARAQRELEEMKAQMERLRLEKSAQAEAEEQKRLQESEVEGMRRAYKEMLEAKAKAEQEAAAARAEAMRLKHEAAEAPNRSPVFGASHGPSGDGRSWNASSPTVGPSPKVAPRSSSTKASSPALPRDFELSGGNGSESPSVVPPHASLGSSSREGGSSQVKRPGTSSVPGGVANTPSLVNSGKGKSATPPAVAPARDSKRATRLISDDSMSESDDEDFWGTSGPGAKPSLGNNGGPSSGTGGGGAGGASGGFGNDLDEWAF